MSTDSRELFHILTLGCKINQYESQAIAEVWREKGLVETPDAAEADVVVVNSCAVTAQATADVRAAVRRIRRENTGARIVLTGCATRLDDSDWEQGWIEMGADEVVDALDKSSLLGREGADFRISGYDRARAVLKVQDGCSHRCTYCIVPLARGPATSRPVRDIVAEIERLLAGGWREVVLSGVNLGQFGRDFEVEYDLWDLVSELEARLADEWAGRFRIRLSSLDPGLLTDKALDVIDVSRLLAPHLHVSLQSLDEGILRRMGRGHYGPREIADFLKALGEIWPRFGLGADLLVGFPGESEKAFAATLERVRALPLTYGHVFPFSPRPGTKAATFPDQVDPGRAKARASELREVLEHKRTVFLGELAGLDELAVVVETAGPDQPAGGRCEFYAPCVFVGEDDPAGRLREIVPARPIGVREGSVLVMTS